MPLKLKSCYCTVLLVLAFLSTSAQQFLNYQAIAWDATRIPKANSTVTVQIGIRSGNIHITPEYTETFTVPTNQFGYFNIEIGSSKPSVFKTIDWSKRPKFLEVKVDGVFVDNSEMPSVPYALYAEQVNLKAGAGISIQGNEISNTQKLELSNDTLELVPNGNKITLPKDTIGAYRSVAPILIGPGILVTPLLIPAGRSVGYMPILSVPISQSNQGPYLILANVKDSEGTFSISVNNKNGTRTELSSFSVMITDTVQNWWMYLVPADHTVVLSRYITQSEIPASGSRKLYVTAQLGVVKLF